MTRAADGVRRAVDVLVAGLGMVILAPLLAAIWVATRVTAGGPVLFRQRRLGRGGVPFDLFKFRTMRPPRPGRENPAFDAERITSIGRFLRSSSLDELPSLWNLVRGDMSLVGPRPLPDFYWRRYRGDEYERFTVRPGITGLAQVEGRNAVSWDERLAIDVRYVRNRTLVGDLRILMRTVPAVLSARGVDSASGVTMTELPPERAEPSAIPTAQPSSDA